MPLSLNANALVTLDALKAWLANYDPLETSEDDRLVAIINATSQAIESRTGRYFVARESTDVYDGNGRATLLLRKFPIAADPSSVTIWDGLASVEQIKGTDYEIDKRLGRLHRIGGFGTLIDTRDPLGLTWPRGFQNITVVASVGFATDADGLLSACPDLVEAALETMKFVYDRRRAQGLAVTTVNVQSMNLTIATGLPRDVRDRIDAYRMPL